MSWSEVKKINSDVTKPLDVLIMEKTNVKIQTVTIKVPGTTSKSPTSSTGTATIETIDVSKSLTVPISTFILTDTSSSPYVTGISYDLSSTSVSATISFCNPGSVTGKGISLTVAVITFGGNVS